MADKKFDYWFGVPRKKIKWYPRVDPAVCIGCGLCAVICGRGVYSYDLVTKKPIVVKPFNCLVGCQTCANLCPVGAIEFPSPEVAREAAREYKVFIKVKKMLEEKFSKELIETALQYQREEIKQQMEMNRVEES